MADNNRLRGIERIGYPERTADQVTISKLTNTKGNKNGLDVSILNDSLSPTLQAYISQNINGVYDYDQVIHTQDKDTGEPLIFFYNAGVEQIAIYIRNHDSENIPSGAYWEISIKPNYLLLEDGDNILLEDGGRIIL